MSHERRHSDAKISRGGRTPVCRRLPVEPGAYLLGLTLAVFLCAAGAAAEPATVEPGSAPFYDQEPYDLIILNDAAKTKIKALPLNLPDGRVPAAPKATDKLRMRRFEDPDTDYDVQWQDIAEVKLFDQLVLEKARQLVDDSKFNEAFDYYEFLRRDYPKAVGLDEAIADFLYAEAKDWQRNRNYDNALVLLRTLYERQPQRPGLEAAMAAATGKLVEKYVKESDYASVRRLVRELRTRFPNGVAAPRFEQQMNERATAFVAQGTRRARRPGPDQGFGAWRAGAGRLAES